MEGGRGEGEGAVVARACGTVDGLEVVIEGEGVVVVGETFDGGFCELSICGRSW